MIPALILFMLTGVGLPAQSVPATKPKSAIVQLAEYAKTKGIRWKIFCTSDEDREQYMGWAIQPGASFDLFAEDGAKDYWVTDEHPTQTSVAAQLLEEIRGIPNMKPRHKEEEKHRVKKCLRTLTNDNYQLKCVECDK